MPQPLIPKRARDKDEEVNAPKRTKPKFCEFYVSFTDYRTHYEPFLPRAETWWETAWYRPAQDSDCQNMEVDEQLLWRAINAGYNILLSGPAGAGKSHLIKRFVAH